MRKILTLISALLLIFAFFGCEKESPTEGGVTVPAPSNLTLAVVGADSLSLQLNWTAANKNGDVDGYIVYFESAAIGSTTTATIYTHTPAALGEYKVKAYEGSNTSEFSNTASTELVETVNPVGPVYWMAAPSAVGPSGYGWDDDGSGSTYSMANPNADTAKAMTDFYVDSVGLGGKGTCKIITPDNLYATWNATWIYDFDNATVYDTISVVPPWGNWDTWGQAHIENNDLCLYVKDKYFVKIKITEHNTTGDHYIMFHYGFQSIPGFKRLK